LKSCFLAVSRSYFGVELVFFSFHSAFVATHHSRMHLVSLFALPSLRQ
jgi:hypothetical protein